MKHLIVILLAIILGISNAARADEKPVSAVANYSVSPTDLAIQLPNTDWKDESYRVQISRKFDGAQQEKLLRIAESVYPRRADVLAAGKKMSGQLSDKDKAAKELWWWDDFDGVRLPYAITASSVIYYWQKLREFRIGDFSRSHGIKMSSADMKYVADIMPLAEFGWNKTTFRDVYVAQMSLIYNQRCGNMCEMSIYRGRAVVMSKDGAVLAVIGDRAEGVIVS